MFSIEPKDVATKKLYGLMVSSIGPRPIAFASTISKNGKPNLSPFSFFNMVSGKPPLVVFSPLRRMSDGTTKDTLHNAEATKEVVINIVNYDIVQQASLASTSYAEGINEFEKSGLTMMDSDLVKPKRVAESPVQFECKVNDIIAMGKEGGAGNLIICEVVKMHVDEKIMYDGEKIDQYKLDQVARMGGSWYTRANAGMFEVPKPITTIGMGVDNLPFSIKNSKVLTGNDLGKLGNVEKKPEISDIEHFVKDNDLNEFIQESSPKKIHAIAQEYLKKDDVENAWKLLLAKQ